MLNSFLSSASSALLCLALGFPLLGQKDHGTAAVGVWTQGKVILATDSKLTHTKGVPATVTCKIRYSGKFFFAMSGFYGQDGSDFDAWQIVTKALRKAETVHEGAGISEKAIGPRLKSAIDKFRADDPSGFSAAFQQVYLAACITGIGGPPVMSCWEFGTDGTTRRVEYPRPGTASRIGDVGFLNYGRHAAFDLNYPTQQSMAVLLTDPAGAVRRAIQLEIDGESAHVGPPRSILEVTANNYRWIEAGQCSTERAEMR